MIVELFLLVGVVSVVFAYWAERRRVLSLNNTEFPLPPIFRGRLPIIGHAHLFFGNTQHVWKMLKVMGNESLEKGGIITVSIGSWTFHVVTDPEDCLKISKTCLNKDSFYEIAKPWLGDGLFTASETIWKRHFKLLIPAFNQQVLDGYIDEFNRQGRKIVNTFAAKVNEGPFDHRAYLEEVALDIVYRATIGIGDDDVDEKEKESFMVEYTKNVSEIKINFIERLTNPWFHNDTLYYYTAHRKRRDELIKAQLQMSYNFIQKGKAALKKNEKNIKTSGRKGKSFFNILLELAAEGTFTDTEVREEMDTIVVAGFDTSSIFMTYILTMLGSYPDVQDKVFKELQEVFGNLDRDVEKQDFSKLVYLDAVMKETLRIYPVGPLVARHIDKDIQLKNHTLPAGGTCFLFFYGMHRHPVWGLDAEEFKPERWLNQTSAATLTAFGGFSIGRRVCIGQKFAMMSVKTIIAHVLRRYQVSADHTKMQLKLDVTLNPVSGHHISLKCRN